MADVHNVHYRHVLDELHALQEYLAEAQKEAPSSLEYWMLRTVLSTAMVAVAEMMESNCSYALNPEDWATLLQFFTTKRQPPRGDVP